MKALDELLMGAAMTGSLMAEDPVAGVSTTISDGFTDAVVILDARWRFVYLNAAAGTLFRRDRAELLGSSIWELFPTSLNAPYRRALGAGQGVAVEMAYSERSVCLEMRAYPLPTGFVAYLRDITARKGTETTLGRYQERLLALHEAAVLLAAQTDPTAAIETALQSAGALLGASSATFYRWDAAAGLLRCAHNWQVPANDTTPDQRPGEGLAGHAFLRGEPLLVNDYPGWAHAMPSGRAADLQAALAVPLVRTGQTLGVVVMRAYDEAIRFTPDDARLLALFADQVAAALENARLHDEARRELAERARAEAALRASEGRYRMILEQASDGIFVNDTEGRFLEVNARACAMLGYTREELLRLGAQDTLDPADLVALPLVVPAPGAERTVFERRLRRKDGTTFPVEVSAARLADGRVQAILRDISDRHAVEAALRASEANLAAAQRIAHLGSWEYDLARDELCWSEEVYRIFGREPVGGPVTDAAYWEAVHPDDRDAVARRYRDSLATGQGYDLEHRVLRPDGTIRVVQMRAELVRDATGTPTRRIGTALDITERAQATDRLRVQARIHELIAQGAALPRTLGILTELIERELGAARCSILLLDRDGVTLRDCAGPRLPTAYRRAIDGVRAGPDVGSCGTAVYLRTAVVVADIAADPRWADFRDLALAHGLRACWSLPILAADGRQVLGTFAVYHDVPHTPSTRERAVVEQHLALVAVAIERQRDEAALRAGEERLRAVVSSLPVLLFAYDQEGMITLAEGHGLAALGSAPGIGVGEDYRERYRDEPEACARIARALAGEAVTGEIEYRGHPYEIRVTPVRDEAGATVGATALLIDVTERRATEEALRQGAASFESLFHARGEGRVITAGGRIVAANQEATALIGHEEGDLLDRSATEFTAPEFRELTRAHIAAGYDRPYESALLHRDGPSLPVEIVGSTISYRGRPARLAAIRDIRERHEAEAALRSREAMLAQSQRIAHLGSWEYDAVVGTHSWSDEHYRIFGVDRATFVPTRTSILALAHPDDRAAVERTMAWALADEADFDLEYRIVRPGGEIRTIHAQCEVIRDATGRPIRLIGTALDITERARLEAQLQYQAFHDPLTGLPNRALFLDRLGQALVSAERAGAPCAVLFLDLDRFKTVNDSLGHAAGDQLLVAVAARLRAGLRAGDTLARFGGDEFAALLPEVAGAGEALRVAERLHAALLAPVTVEGREFVATASAGLALGTGVADTPEDLLRFADVALYRAKEAGRARTELFSPGMNVAAQERLDLEHDLRRALARGELVVHYQPKVDLRTGTVAGLEALVRWQHPVRGLISPGTFIPLAEETGLIVPLGRWVLAEACRQLRAWQERYPAAAAPIVAVNLSARQFRRPELVADVAETLAATGLAASQLLLEVTETAAMAHPEGAIATLTALRELGVRLAIDDFGTGHASLAYLQRLPVDTLKIDRSFFQIDARNRAIVRSVAGLETAEQVAWARAAGCDWGQGYHFTPPRPPAEIDALWATGLRYELPADIVEGA